LNSNDLCSIENENNQPLGKTIAVSKQ